MPYYTFACDVCKEKADFSMSVREYCEFFPVHCDTPMRKVWTPPAIITPSHLRPENQQANEKQKAWMERPEVQAKLKSGEYYPISKGELS